MTSHRLPRTVTPLRYVLELVPDLDAATFTGTVAIDVDVHEETDEVVLNAAELSIERADVIVADVALAATTSLDEDSERLTLELDTTLAPGPATIEIAFEGILNDKLRGFYRSTFDDDDGVTHVIATTQFESTSARRAFPCWDEPDLKATFEVTLVVPDDLLAVSSGPEIGRTPVGDGRVRVAFGPTMVMSTYVLAFVVGPLEATEPVDVDGVALRVIYPRGKASLAPFALDAGAFSLQFFTDYFALEYPDAKLDLVGVPDFAFGAMENQGCIIFREALLLVDPTTSSQPEQERAVDVIAHEIAHMWFGNLVTMRWWNGIWLKEAFATFCETMCSDRYRPEWKRWVSFGLARSMAFDIDALGATRAIEFEVVSPDDAEAMYDVLTYEKGAAVVRMLEQYLGADAFRDGVRDYLARHAFSNTDNHDLWESIERATGEPVRDVMESWIFQGGYPLISVERTGETTVRLRQERFRFDGDDDHERTWRVPVVLRAGRGDTSTLHPVLLSESELDHDLGHPFDWLNANADGNGFYRVRQVGELRAASLDHQRRLAPIERYGLVDDAWAAFLGDHIGLDELVETIVSMVGVEDDLAVWERIAAVTRSIHHHLDERGRKAFAPLAIEWATGALHRIGTMPRADETARTAQLRARLMTLAGVCGHEPSIARARSILGEGGDPEETAAAISIVAAHGTDRDLENFIDGMRGAPTPQESRRFMFALADFPEPQHLERLIELVEEGDVRSQDAPFVLGRSLGNSETGVLAWNYIRGNWDDLIERFPHNSIIRMIAGVPALADPELAADIETFFEDHPVPQAGKTLGQHLERLRVNVGVRRRIRAHYS